MALLVSCGFAVEINYVSFADDTFGKSLVTIIRCLYFKVCYSVKLRTAGCPSDIGTTLNAKETNLCVREAYFL